MSLYLKCHEFAAQMVGGGDPGMLHHKLYDYLTSINALCHEAGGELVSRQVIALAISSWMNENPDARPYGD